MNFGMKKAKSIKTHMATNGHLDLDKEEFRSKTLQKWL